MFDAIASRGSPPALYVVILNWSLPQETILCVESVQACLPAGARIIIVDNNSPDDSVQQFLNHFGGQVTIKKNADNLGFAGGVNVGIRLALAEGAQVVLLLNNDTVVAPDMIEELFRTTKLHPQAGIVAPAIFYQDEPQRIWRCADIEHRWFPVPVQVTARTLERSGLEPMRVDYVTACGMLIRRELLQNIGLFDTDYFMYFEDADFCRRARAAGYEIWCTPRARMWHKVSQSARKQKPGARYAQWWGRARFFRRHPHGFSRALTMAYLLARSVGATLRDLTSKEPELIKAGWMGFIDGTLDQPSRHAEFFR